MPMSHKEALQRAHDAYCRHETAGWDDDFIRAIRAYNEALGLVLLPKEPTPAMRAEYHRGSIAPIGSLSLYGYRSMLAAAPDPFKDDAP